MRHARGRDGGVGGEIFGGAEGAGLWELLLAAGSLDWAVDAAIAAQEPAFLAKYAFQLAQGFNIFYHKHHILSEGGCGEAGVFAGDDGDCGAGVGAGAGVVGD